MKILHSYYIYIRTHEFLLDLDEVHLGCEKSLANKTIKPLLFSLLIIGDTGYENVHAKYENYFILSFKINLKTE